MSSSPESSATSSPAELAAEGVAVNSLTGWSALSARLGRWLPADLNRSQQWRGYAFNNAKRLAGRRHLGG